LEIEYYSRLLRGIFPLLKILSTRSKSCQEKSARICKIVEIL